ncbi:MAG: DUF5683 domain-containing protein, partial [Endomicrobia bacterium]|nr:DUF5683 domain-containing protein [Endomicrobiia bacterium]
MSKILVGKFQEMITVLCIIILFFSFLPHIGYSQQEDKSEVQLGHLETTIMLSAVFPGLGQLYNKQKIKGAVFLGATVCSLALAIIMYSTANQIYEDYKTLGDPYHPKYDDYLSYITMTNVFLALTGVIWTANIVDAYLTAKSKKVGFD